MEPNTGLFNTREVLLGGLPHTGDTATRQPHSTALRATALEITAWGMSSQNRNKPVSQPHHHMVPDGGLMFTGSTTPSKQNKSEARGPTPDHSLCASCFSGAVRSTWLLEAGTQYTMQPWWRPA